VLRAQHRASEVRKAIPSSERISYKRLFYVLATECGWTIDYIAGLKSKQIRLFWEGRKDHFESLEKSKGEVETRKSNLSNQLQSASGGKFKKPFPKSRAMAVPPTPDITDTKDMLRSGMFKVGDMRKKKNG